MKWPLASLLVVALGSGLLWRMELEWRWGWASLTWAWKFYWAFPIGIAGFVIWASSVAHARNRKAFASAVAGLLIIAMVSLWECLWFLDSGWRLPLAGMPGMTIQAAALAMPLLWTLLPLAFGWVCRYYGVQVHFGLHVLSSILFVASWPIAIGLLQLVHHRGGADLIHALKSGFVIPLLIISLGFPLLAAKPGA